jgi:sortase (surface protein transpeptidase)
MSDPFQKLLKIFGFTLTLASLTLLSIYLFNYYEFWIEARTYVDHSQEKAILEEPKETQPQPPTVEELSDAETQRLLPAKNLSLPKENRIIIAKLGVNAPIFGGDDSQSALRQGAWIAPGFKTPPGNTLLQRPEPIIISSHLYGYDDWSEEFRDRVSFSGLEALNTGDQIEIIWQQRQYIYEIEAGEVSDVIGRYDTDLIVYTCLDLTGSDDRTIRYANLREDLWSPANN